MSFLPSLPTQSLRYNNGLTDLLDVVPWTVDECNFVFAAISINPLCRTIYVPSTVHRRRSLRKSATKPRAGMAIIVRNLEGHISRDFFFSFSFFLLPCEAESSLSAFGVTPAFLFLGSRSSFFFVIYSFRFRCPVLLACASGSLLGRSFSTLTRCHRRLVHLPAVDLASADLSGANISAHLFWQTLASIYFHLLAWILPRIPSGFLCDASPLVDAHVSVPQGDWRQI
ncbi:hypothetical protein C8J57DRAFT_1516217 [Mycena rebaudengoi]|nr:hypothetical protein C8J57DRAFT_1516217 [Mycena rebaudengoi]